jgi:hypothetical protein
MNVVNMNDNNDNINNDNINNINNNINDNIDNLDDIYDAWDEPATPLAEPVAPIIAPNGWHWYPDDNGNLFSLYFDGDGNECMVWMQNDDGSYYWRCAGVGYNCRDIGIEGRRGIFFQDLLVGTMILDEFLSVTWLPETYINQTIQHVEYINYNNYINYNDVNDITDTDETDDEYDP